MEPIYRSPFIDGLDIDAVIESTPWLDRTEARRECFMSDGGGVSYTYGKGRGVRTYTSIDYTDTVRNVLGKVNVVMAENGWGDMNGCFLNCYEHDRQHLGWHADDFREMDHSCPVVVVSFGEAREIWWRPFGESGIVPEDQRKLLDSGSLFIMPPGMQHTHEHRIPKGSCSMGPRVSMTFRRFQ
jgi:alkylated DNA repair dioxygenase AlkB